MGIEYSKINWKDEPNIDTPINAINLNKMDSAIFSLNSVKSDQSDLLQCVKNVTYNTSTGVFVFTWQNGTSLTVDLNIEKIPVSFSLTDDGTLIMVTADGQQFSADIASLIKEYDFDDSGTIEWQVRTVDDVKYVKADIIDGTVTADKLQPNFLADCNSAKSSAETASTTAQTASTNALTYSTNSEAWANGTRNGTPVGESDPAYHNNAKYWKDQSNVTTLTALTDTNITNATNLDTLVYDIASNKWVNSNVLGDIGSILDSINGEVI